jgi:hypothetical protein
VLKRAYELAQKGDFLGAAKDCELQFQCAPNLVAAVEGVDFYVLAGAPAEALRFVKSVDERVRAFSARLEFFRSLAHWDQGAQGDARSALAKATALGYDNDERFRMEWSKRLSKEDVEALLVSLRQGPGVRSTS